MFQSVKVHYHRILSNIVQIESSIVSFLLLSLPNKYRLRQHLSSTPNKKYSIHQEESKLGSILVRQCKRNITTRLVNISDCFSSTSNCNEIRSTVSSIKEKLFDLGVSKIKEQNHYVLLSNQNILINMLTDEE